MADGQRGPVRQPRARLRCAVYTRKSSEEGLEQEFNSLEAQREACVAYVASQRHEGWTLLSPRYDDGGYSGGTTDRPALQRLLAEIAAGRIDVVVVYKVDRLTRSLGDFARIVELFDRHNVSFVSVTQAFNTTTSMGRLTLNVLLSFAQFEREVTGERIRDKIAASKRKGMWMGGQPPLGYDVHSRKLVVNEAEAETVRHIFGRYLELRSVRELKAELDSAGIVSKARRARDGSPYGAQRFSRGALYVLLQNRIYRGAIVHKGASYPGEHRAIVDEALFEEVQSVLSSNRVERAGGRTTSEPSLLTGLLYDAQGERLTPTHANKRGTRFRYYVSRHLITGGENPTRGHRLPAPAIERLVQSRLHELLANPAELLGLVRERTQEPALATSAADKAALWSSGSSKELRSILIAIVSRIVIHPDRIEIAIRPDELAAWILGQRAPERASAGSEEVTITVPVSLQQRGHELRIVLASQADEAPASNPALVRLLARAHTVSRRLLHDRATIDEVASEQNVTASYVTRLMRLSFLAPELVSSILAGRHPPELSATRLMQDTRMPLDWAAQRQALGFG